MSANRPAFRVMKNGYDRFAVDDAIENYAVQIEQLERKVELYQNKLTETMRELEESKARCRQLISTDAARREAAENIARLSLREANDIINTANKNADIIIREALASARGILEDLSALYDEAGSVRTEASGQLEKLLKGFLLGFSKAKVILDGEDKGRVRRIGGIDILPIESADDQLSLQQIVHALLPAHSRERDHPDGVFGRTAP